MELQTRKQQEGETLQELAGEIQYLTIQCVPEVSYEDRERLLGVPAFLEALSDDRLRFELGKKQFSTVDDALDEALHLQSWTDTFGTPIPDAPRVAVVSSESETDDSGITETSVRRSSFLSGSDSGGENGEPAPPASTTASDSPAPAARDWP